VYKEKRLDNLMHDRYIWSKIMNKSAKIILLVFLASGIILAGVDLISFTATSSGGNILLNWQTSSETNLKQYVVERRSVSGGFSDIAHVLPQSDRNYQYVDKSAFKTSDQVYIYQLRIEDNDGSLSYSKEISVAHSNVSSVKRTWGSIKALFR
jgi:hypothetical protein